MNLCSWLNALDHLNIDALINLCMNLHDQVSVLDKCERITDQMHIESTFVSYFSGGYLRTGARLGRRKHGIND